MVIVSTSARSGNASNPSGLANARGASPTASVVYQYDERSKKVVPYSLAATLLKVLLRLVPTVVMMVTAATAIRATRSSRLADERQPAQPKREPALEIVG
jgi:hypothetical protein